MIKSSVFLVVALTLNFQFEKQTLSLFAIQSSDRQALQANETGYCSQGLELAKSFEDWLLHEDLVAHQNAHY